MNSLDILVEFYARLRDNEQIPFWILKPFRRVLRNVANIIIPRYLRRVKTHSVRGKEIIVSLTSFPARINNVWQVIVCMLNQTLPPKEINLWLSRDQFPSIELIPKTLRELEGDVFKIRLVDGDIRSHKKYYYLATNNVEDYVFIIDDDIYYPSTLLEKVWMAHLKHPDAIISNFGYHIRYEKDGSLSSYKYWEECFEESDNQDLFFGSGGGTLIQFPSVYKDVTNLKLSLKMTPLADDVWLNAMARLAGVKIHMMPHGLFLPILTHNDVRLTTLNNGESQNDVQIKAVDEYYCGVYSSANKKYY